MRSNLVLLGGVAAVVAGVFSFCVNALFSLLLVSNEVIPWPITPLLTLAGIVTTLLYAFGLAGLYALLGRRSLLGIAGLVLVSLAFVIARPRPVDVRAAGHRPPLPRPASLLGRLRPGVRDARGDPVTVVVGAGAFLGAARRRDVPAGGRRTGARSVRQACIMCRVA